MAGVVVATVAVAVAAWLLDQRRPGRVADFNRGTNAVWLAHTWVEDPRGDGEIAELAEQLRTAQMTDVFAHVGPLTAAGQIAPERYPEAAAFARRLKAAHGGPLRVFAWVGQIEARAGGVLDLGSAETRHQTVRTSAVFPDQLGFDGIHYDIEPIFDGDERFLALLDETRRQLPGRPISAATGKWAPDGPIGAIGRQLAPGSALWSSSYYAEVARRVDQVVPMLYDTGTRPGELYERVVAIELSGILDATRSTGADVLAGVPTYDDRTAGHDPASENLHWALPGVATAVAGAGAPSHFAGVSIYAHWQTSRDEWATYDRLWIGSERDQQPTSG
ncbi:MAG TPA: hypothetical protein VHL09_02305 [Dehalococcoidia bacterium]|nr:hypothetical protein [Dehalococcoidia bacterium]